MSSVIIRLTSKGQVTLPPHMLDALGIKPGDYLTLTSTPDGVLISVANGRTAKVAESEHPLPELIRRLGAELEAAGITEEEQLDEEIKRAKHESFVEWYGDLKL